MIGRWKQGMVQPESGNGAISAALERLTKQVVLLDADGLVSVSHDGAVTIGGEPHGDYNVCAYAPPLHPKSLGDERFKKTYNLKYAYVAGAMANGITSVEMVEAAGKAGMIGFFGAAGLSLDGIEDACRKLRQGLGDRPFGFNLISTPAEPDVEAAVVDLYLELGIPVVSASAYVDLTLPLLYYRFKGIHRDPEGNIVCPNRVVAKVSRVEVARKFFAPPPEKLLGRLVQNNMLTNDEAKLAESIPVAEELTAEADSGGHTDNRPALSLLPTMLALRDEMEEKYRYDLVGRRLCVGLGGGIATPVSAAAAFSMGAAYILTGSVNQSCVEAGTSEIVRRMLAEARQADVTMAPSADMFELGAKVQVLKRGTMFPLRASKLHDLYLKHDRYESIPEKDRVMLERDFFRCGFDQEWESTKQFFQRRDPSQINRAENNPKHKMALVFRSYLGRASGWAVSGDPSRKIDYQIWCGPALGAFNEWVKGSFLEKPENRKTATVAMNLLFGAAHTMRVAWLRSQAALLPADACKFSPMKLEKINELLEDQ